MGRSAWGWLLAVAGGLIGSASATAQTNGLIGPVSRQSQVAATPEPGPGDLESGVSFIDSALPRTQLRLRFDASYHNRLHDRAAYLFPQSVLPGSRGYKIPETRVDMQEFSSYVEYGLDRNFSFFIESPMRFVNPENNPNTWGGSDLNLGFKLVCFADELFYMTFQFRGYLPTGREQGLGTKHVSIEPALLANINLASMFRVEGEFRYWLPLGGGEVAGDHIRYGVGLSYGQRTPGQIWLMPVIEGIGWTILDGKGISAQSESSYFVQDVRGDTILTVNAGMRLGFSEHADIYAGYGRALTGDQWFRDYWRVEFRWLF